MITVGLLLIAVGLVAGLRAMVIVGLVLAFWGVIFWVWVIGTSRPVRARFHIY